MSTATNTAPTTRTAAAIPFLRLVGVELRKQLDTRAGTWLLIAIAVLSAAAIVLQLWLGEPEMLTWEFLTQGAAAGSSLLLPLIGIMAATGEWTQRTALQTFALEPRRTRVNLAKVVSAVLLGLVIVALICAAGAAVNLVGIAAFDGAGTWDLTFATVGGMAVTVTIYVVMGVAFGLAFLNTAIAIVAYLVLPIVINMLTLVPALTGPIAWVDLSTAILPMYDWSYDGEQWGHLAVSLLVWVALPLGVGLWRTARREVS